MAGDVWLAGAFYSYCMLDGADSQRFSVCYHCIANGDNSVLKLCYHLLHGLWCIYSEKPEAP